MTEAITADAAPFRGTQIDWHSINWAEAERYIRRLQMRIAKATRERSSRKVRALQWLLTRSFYGKALAVRRVTENQGKKTPGVDGETWNTPESKAKAVTSLRRHGYQPKPLRRVFIPKANGKLRPLGIPTIKDRAMQALHLLALEPIAETTGDPNSYGFRPKRATRDAIGQCFKALSNKYAAPWVLEADITGCFDSIPHAELLKSVARRVVDRYVLRLIKMWLKAPIEERDAAMEPGA